MVPPAQSFSRGLTPTPFSASTDRARRIMEAGIVRGSLNCQFYLIKSAEIKVVQRSPYYP